MSQCHWTCSHLWSIFYASLKLCKSSLSVLGEWIGSVSKGTFLAAYASGGDKKSPENLLQTPVRAKTEAIPRIKIFPDYIGKSRKPEIWTISKMCKTDTNTLWSTKEIDAAAQTMGYDIILTDDFFWRARREIILNWKAGFTQKIQHICLRGAKC